MSTVILAGSIREANAYRLDTGDRWARFAQTPAQIKQATKIIELAGFADRRDRFTLEQARDSRRKYGRPVEYVDATDWKAPLKVVEAIVRDDDDLYGERHPFGDLTDEANLAALKEELNKVGYTLKKLPAKTKAEAPVVETPAGF